MALIDDQAQPLAPRGWAWWSRGDVLLDDDAVCLARVHVAGWGWARELDLAPWSYRALGRDALERSARRLAGARIDVVNVTGHATNVGPCEEGGLEVEVKAPGSGRTTVRARWVLDSVGLGTPDATGALSGAHLDFHGWHVQARRATFTPGVLTLMDFRTPQTDGVTFVYVLPRSSTEALVERTAYLMSDGAPPLRHEDALRRYLAEHLACADFLVVDEECGTIPLVVAPAHAAARTVLIGGPAGAVKASTGYAFARIQRHSAALASAFADGSDVSRAPGPRSSRWYAALDRALLTALREDPDGARRILEALLRRASGPQLMRFLDEQAPLTEQLRLFAGLPWWCFVRAHVRAAAGTLDRRRRRGARLQ